MKAFSEATGNEKFLFKTIKDYDLVIQNDKFGVMFNNEWLLEPEYVYIDFCINENLFITEDENQIVRFFNTTGQQVGIEYTTFYGFFRGFAIVEKDMGLFLLDKEAKERLQNYTVLSIPKVVEEGLYISGTRIENGIEIKEHIVISNDCLLIEEFI